MIYRIHVYATAPGEVAADGDGRNGLYTVKLLKHMQTPGLPIELFFKQVRRDVRRASAKQQITWTESSLIGDFYFNPRKSGNATKRQETALQIQPGVDGSTARLFVMAEPEGARVRILNIGPKFYQGIELEPGRYHVEVSAAGHAQKRMWLTLDAGDEKELGIRLERYAAGTTRGRFTNSLGMEFVAVPAGSFMMGSKLGPEEVARKYGGEAEWYKDEHPQHNVRIGEAFYLQTTEVTVGQWRKFIRETGYKTDAELGGGANTLTGLKWGKRMGAYWDNPGFWQNNRHPVTCVSWNDVQKFIQWLNRKEGARRYRLPTEAQWEYACRAGTQTVRYWGDDPDDACRYANVHDQTSKRVNNVTWENHDCDDGHAATAPVGNYGPNAFGIYDMLGNVWEWCRDRYGKYPSGLMTDSDSSSGRSNRVIRGGGWYVLLGNVRCADRFNDSPDLRNSNLGFRLLWSK